MSTAKIDCERGACEQEFPCRPPPSGGTYYKLLGLAGLLSFVLLMQHFWLPSGLFHGWDGENDVALDDVCPQAQALAAPRHEALLAGLDREFSSSEFKLKAYESLGGAIRIPTESHDDVGPPTEDPRWEVQGKLHEYLRLRFPKVHAGLKLTKVYTYALVYEWEGIENLKPLLLAAHLDVVPVNPATYDDWIHPPYSGHYDGEWIWGRGSYDDKAGLIGTLTAIETLLEHGFIPSRTVILAFGNDEEKSGGNGARSIAKYLLDTYGADSLAMIVDEGGGYRVMDGTAFASPAVTEKGSMNVRMDVLTPGGHSSRPPKHTGIGILADLITELEAHPHEPKLVRGTTSYQGLECRARYDTGFPASLKKLLRQSRTSNEKLRELEQRLIDFDPLFYARAGTTQAIDLIGGGVKVNALPEAVWAVANHRIADHSSPSELMSRFTDITLPVAARHNMTLEAFGMTVGPQGPSWGTIRLTNGLGSSFVPFPVTPTAGSGPYKVLSGTIRSTFQTHLRTDGTPTSAVVSPGIATGESSNTDTCYYWSLTKHIFRYRHLEGADVFGMIHGTNEAIRAEGFLEQIRFITRLVLNADQSDLLE